jgi:hypothetical protein
MMPPKPFDDLLDPWRLRVVWDDPSQNGDDGRRAERAVDLLCNRFVGGCRITGAKGIGEDLAQDCPVIAFNDDESPGTNGAVVRGRDGGGHHVPEVRRGRAIVGH